jgi:hypothetical protein
MSSISTTNISLSKFLIEDAENYEYDAYEHCSEIYTYLNGDCFQDVKLDSEDWIKILDVVETVLLEYEIK